MATAMTRRRGEHRERGVDRLELRGAPFRAGHARHSITPRGSLALSRQFPDLCVARLAGVPGARSLRAGVAWAAVRHAPEPRRRSDKDVRSQGIKRHVLTPAEGWVLQFLRGPTARRVGTTSTLSTDSDSWTYWASRRVSCVPTANSVPSLLRNNRFRAIAGDAKNRSPRSLRASTSGSRPARSTYVSPVSLTM